MKRVPLPVFALAITMVATPLWGTPLPVPPSMTALEALSGMDFVPDRSNLMQLFDGDIASLVGLANDDGDPGIRLRAYHSLRHFGGDPIALAGLRTGLMRYRNARLGIDVLYLLAVVDALGEAGEASDVVTIAPLLAASESRDLRAAAARALGALGAASACTPLRARFGDEQPMVRIAITRALNRLGALCETP